MYAFKIFIVGVLRIKLGGFAYKMKYLSMISIINEITFKNKPLVEVNYDFMS